MRICIAIICFLFNSFASNAQELNARIIVNYSQIQGTDVSVFENLQETIEKFMNERQWTNAQYRRNERINCNFNITITKYDATSNLFTCKALIQSNRPVYNSAYTTTTYNNTDNDFNFEFAQFDQLNFNEETVDNQLTALLAYYAYLLIGIDMDTFSPLGGEECLLRCYNIANNAQSLNFTGWKSFDDYRNRYAIINDYLDSGMAPFRQLQYKYYRQGLDEMATNADRGRTNITTTIENELKQCHADRPMSLLPQIWTDYKRDELASIYKGKGTQREKESVYEVLFSINASQSNAWDQIKE